MSPQWGLLQTRPQLRLEFPMPRDEATRVCRLNLAMPVELGALDDDVVVDEEQQLSRAELSTAVAGCRDPGIRKRHILRSIRRRHSARVGLRRACINDHYLELIGHGVHAR